LDCCRGGLLVLLSWPTCVSYFVLFARHLFSHPHFCSLLGSLFILWTRSVSMRVLNYTNGGMGSCCLTGGGYSFFVYIYIYLHRCLLLVISCLLGYVYVACLCLPSYACAFLMPGFSTGITTSLPRHVTVYSRWRGGEGEGS